MRSLESLGSHILSVRSARNEAVGRRRRASIGNLLAMRAAIARGLHTLHGIIIIITFVFNRHTRQQLLSSASVVGRLDSGGRLEISRSSNATLLSISSLL